MNGGDHTDSSGAEHLQPARAAIHHAAFACINITGANVHPILSSVLSGTGNQLPRVNNEQGPELLRL